MPTHSGPNIVDNGLVLSLDAADTNCISPAANEVFNNSEQFIKNIINKTQVISANNGVKIGNLNYYTAFAIDYPENTFGGPAASRDGITPGFNVTSGTKSFEFKRALNYAVWDEDTESFVYTKIYDTYLSSTSIDNTFVSDYETQKNKYPNSIHIVAGSHRDRYHTTNQYNVLKEIGAPINVDSIINTSAPEWILVGKPGLGADNAYVWVYQNYSIDPTRVAHAVFPLPINKVNKDNYFEFDGVDDYIDLTLNNASGDWVHSIVFWMKLTDNQSNISTRVDPFQIGNSNLQNQYSAMDISNGNVNWYFYANDTRIQSNIFSANNWYHISLTYSGGGATISNKNIYINGLHRDWDITTGNNYGDSLNMAANAQMSIGRDGIRNSAYFPGYISLFKLYNRALTPQEVKENYNATKSRFGL